VLRAPVAVAGKSHDIGGCSAINRCPPRRMLLIKSDARDHMMMSVSDYDGSTACGGDGAAGGYCDGGDGDDMEARKKDRSAADDFWQH